MNLRFFGCGAAFYPALGNTNAFLELDNDLYCIDFGESAFEKAVSLLPLPKYRNIYIILTHLHADHVGSLASLCSYNYCVLGRKIHVVHPLPTVTELLGLEGISGDFYAYSPSLPEGCALRATPVEVEHAVDMRCFGYLLSDGQETVYYSGDSSRLSGEIVEMLRQGKLSRIYHDVASEESASHCYYQRLAQAVPPELRSRVVTMHFDGDIQEKLKALGFSVARAEGAGEAKA